MDTTDVRADLVARLTLVTRDSISSRYAMLAGHCEEAAGDLAADLHALGHDAVLVWGEYAHPCPQGYPTTGHCWVAIGGLIADPTRGQFGEGPMVCLAGSPEATAYREHYSIPHSQLG
jgi:hypothetical protein